VKFLYSSTGSLFPWIKKEIISISLEKRIRGIVFELQKKFNRIKEFVIFILFMGTVMLEEPTDIDAVMSLMSTGFS
tara:strand:+ start:339 stop:566 length:228 start_codon:yes stop_codon:yes gene_type:complete